MEEATGEVAKILLNGIPFHTFIAFLIAGLVGSILAFGVNVGQAVKKDKSTPNTFRWDVLKVKAMRWVISLLTLIVGIIFNKEILGFGLDSETPIELTLWSAFLVGMGTDQLGRKLSSFKK